MELDEIVTISPTIVPVEGAVVAVEVLSTVDKVSLIEDITGHISGLVEGEIIPAVLGIRRGSQGLSCDIPSTLSQGDIISYVSRSGLVGVTQTTPTDIMIPAQVRVFGSVQKGGTPLNIKQSSIPRRQSLNQSAPIVVVAGSASNTGKTTTARKIIQHLKSKGLRVAAAKLSGLAFLGELRALSTAGPDMIMSFADGGLPTTCNNPAEILEVSLGILHELNAIKPDVIVIEFGSCLLGFYNILPILESLHFRQYIASLVLTASDTAAAWGLKHILKEKMFDVTLLTGPVVNNLSYAGYIEGELGFPAESNSGQMPKMCRLIDMRLDEFGSCKRKR
ncbi:hypothetical protein BBP40_001870 [Aspergillus hancockii]|nr:hypothetical protein BBP40_001870 [Aspergillus hancockii]